MKTPEECRAFIMAQRLSGGMSAADARHWLRQLENANGKCEHCGEVGPIIKTSPQRMDEDRQWYLLCLLCSAIYTEQMDEWMSSGEQWAEYHRGCL
jgi:hypothetical protein